MVVHAAGSLYQRPMRLAIDYADQKGHEQEPALARVYRLIRDDGDWLLVENLPGNEPQAHCTRESQEELRTARLRFFIRRQDLMPVSVTAIHFHGTTSALAIAKGVPLARTTRSGTFRIAVDGFSFNIPVGEKQRGWAYQNLQKLPELAVDIRMRKVDAEVFAAGEVRVYGAEAPFGALPPVELIRSDRAQKIYAIHPSGEDVLAEMWTGCAEVAALIPSGKFDVDAPTPASPLPPMRRGQATLSPGTALYWRGGERAGEVVGEMSYHDEGQPDGGRRCLRMVSRRTRTESAEPLEFLELCVDSKDVRP